MEINGKNVDQCGLASGGGSCCDSAIGTEGAKTMFSDVGGGVGDGKKDDIGGCRDEVAGLPVSGRAERSNSWSSFGGSSCLVIFPILSLEWGLVFFAPFLKSHDQHTMMLNIRQRSIYCIRYAMHITNTTF
jgi:hypothetical protein